MSGLAHFADSRRTHTEVREVIHAAQQTEAHWVSLFDYIVSSSAPYRIGNVLLGSLYRLGWRTWNTTVRAEHTTVAGLGF
jgi:hypothetical protein